MPKTIHKNPPQAKRRNPAREKEVNSFLDRMRSAVKERSLDLSSDEDLSIGIMNLISIEEHLFFTANKTGKDKYYALLNEIREIRKEMLKEIVVDREGEIWCISKHLLASSMRLMEVGTKELTKGNSAKAKSLFQKSYRLYLMFWRMNLKLGEQDTMRQAQLGQKEIALYYDTKCPHCEKVESFLTRHNLTALFNIVKKEVSSSEENHRELEAVFKKHGGAGGEILVPFACLDDKCYMGEEAVIGMFKELIWESVKKKKQEMQELFRKNYVPSHLKSHEENYRKLLDTALNCCKE